MHLVPADRVGRRVIDDHTVCEALAGLGAPDDVRTWAERFSLLADPGRLTLLLCIRGAGEICVSDLAVAAGMNDTTVSQALRLLRAAGAVAPRREGRVVRYRLVDEALEALLARVHTASGDSTHDEVAGSTGVPGSGNGARQAT